MYRVGRECTEWDVSVQSGTCRLLVLGDVLDCEFGDKDPDHAEDDALVALQDICRGGRAPASRGENTMPYAGAMAFYYRLSRLLPVSRLPSAP